MSVPALPNHLSILDSCQVGEPRVALLDEPSTTLAHAGPPLPWHQKSGILAASE